MKTRKRLVVPAVLIGFTCLIWLSACQSTVPTATSASEENQATSSVIVAAPTRTPKPINQTVCDRVNDAIAQYVRPEMGPGEGYFPDQLIISGLPKDIENAVGIYNTENKHNAHLELRSDIAPIQLTRSGVVHPGGLAVTNPRNPNAKPDISDLVISLYMIVPSSSTAQSQQSEGSPAPFEEGTSPPPGISGRPPVLEGSDGTILPPPINAPSDLPLQTALSGLPDPLLVANVINSFANQPTSLLVVAEPNYVLRNPDGILNHAGYSRPGGSEAEASTYPGIIGHSHNSSHGVEGGPGGNILLAVQPISITLKADFNELDFWDQLAFEPDNGTDLNGILGKTTDGPRPENLGEKVTVVVLDSSPIHGVEGYTNYGSILFEDHEFDLCYSNPMSRLDPSISTIVNENNVLIPHMLNEHGLFVASLVHATAPESDLHLIQVLENHSRGDMYSLLGVILHYVNTVSAAPTPTIFNLSLGYEINTDEDLVSLANTSLFEIDKYLKLITKQIKLFRNEGRVLHLDEYDDLPPGVIDKFALDLVIESTYKSGHLMVASAGNEGIGTHSYYPAVHEYVLGVGATNRFGEKSCFSNLADVYAPGGTETFRDDEAVCAIDWDLCSGFNCGILGVVSPDIGINRGFAYWAGTSFSTPQVSGLAALIWSHRPNLKACQIVQLILNNTSSYTSIFGVVNRINIKAALTDDSNPACPGP